MITRPHVHSKENGSFQQSLDAIHSLMHVNSDHSHFDLTCAPAATTPSFKVNLNNHLLWKSAEKMGYVPEKVPRNVRGCVDCGHCNLGCRYNAKQSTITALLEPILLQQHHDHQQQQQYQVDSSRKGKSRVVYDWLQTLRMLWLILTMGSAGYYTIARGAAAIS
jgi:hypothetical protein